jgi:ferredoxin
MVHGAHGLAARDMAEDRAKTMPSVSVRRFGKSVAAKQDEVILDAARHRHIWLPHACRERTYASCRAMVVTAAVTFRPEHPTLALVVAQVDRDGVKRGAGGAPLIISRTAQAASNQKACGGRAVAPLQANMVERPRRTFDRREHPCATSRASRPRGNFSHFSPPFGGSVA